MIVKDDKDYKVDVLKFNLDKAWEISAGVGNHQGDNPALPSSFHILIFQLSYE
nr:hypothetical protein [Sporomusa silvacetica]